MSSPSDAYAPTVPTTPTSTDTGNGAVTVALPSPNRAKFQAIAPPSFELIPRPHLSPEEAAENVAFLKTQVESWLAVLFNVFSSAGKDGQGMVGDVISAWLSIADDKVTFNSSPEAMSCSDTKTRVGNQQSLQENRQSPKAEPDQNGFVKQTQRY